MAKTNDRYFTSIILASILTLSVLFSGCAPLLVGGGAIGGYAIAKHVDEEKAERHK